MSRRGVKMVFSQSLAILCSSSTKTSTITTTSPLNLFTRRIITTSSSSDDLAGLHDPNFDKESQTKPVHVSAQDFAFLHNATPQGNQSNSNEAIMISTEINSNNDNGQFSDEMQKFLRQFRGKLNECLVIEVLSLVKIPEKGARFFIWAGRQIGYSNSARAYDALLEMLGFNNNIFRMPDSFLEEIRKDDNEVLGKLLNVLIQKCCRNGLWNTALEELGRLKDYGYKPTKTTYNALFLVFLKAERLESACLIQKEMSGFGFNMDGFTLGCFVQSLCKGGRWREALKIIEEEEFVPDTVMYTKMISGLCEASLFEEAMNFLHIMRTNSCIPNVVTYRTLIAACLRKKQLGRCKRILNMMITEGCYPSPSVFKSLVHAYCSSGDYAYGYKLLKKMTSCACNPGYVVYNIFVGSICGNEKLPTPDILELAEKAYAEMLDAGLVLNKVNIGNFVRCLCGMGKYDKAFNVIRDMMSKGFIPDTRTYSNVIGFLCQATKIENAYLLFQEMKKNNVTPDVYTYTILIDSFCKAGLNQPACSLFDEMIKDGCSPNVVTFTALIHAHLKLRKVTVANEFFDKMLSHGCIPNIVTYTALIDGHCKAGNIEKACQIYSRMKGDAGTADVDMYFRGDTSNPTGPNVFTYGALVDGLCKAHKVAEASDLLDAMSAVGCEPNHIVYDALIDGFCKVGKLDESQEVFARMSDSGYSPTVYTYSSLIDRLFKDKRLDLALKVLSKMLENSRPPNVVTYTEMIDGLCKAGKTDEAYKLLVMMEEKGCYPNVVTYTAMIDGFGKAGKVDMSLMLLEQMGAKGCAPNFVTYRVLINHCCAAGLLKEAHEILEEMKQTYWPRHVTGYRKVIEGFNKEFLISHGLLDEISADGSSPIIPAYRILVDSFCKAENLKVAFDLHKEISTSLGVSVISKSMYYSMIKGLSSQHEVEKAFELYGDMVKHGHIPEICVLFDLIRGLIEVNKWNEALQLSYSICHMEICWHPGEKT